MREILFRGKSVTEDKWVYGNYSANKKLEFDFIVEDGVLHGVKKETVGQFTGMMDNQGKKIFEGDKTLQGDGEVFYSEQDAMFKIIWRNKTWLHVRGRSQSYQGGEQLFRNSHISLTVIGSIHDK